MMNRPTEASGFDQEVLDMLLRSVPNDATLLLRIRAKAFIAPVFDLVSGVMQERDIKPRASNARNGHVFAMQRHRWVFLDPYEALEFAGGGAADGCGRVTVQAAPARATMPGVGGGHRKKHIMGWLSESN
jgi:hypothetical protein